MLTISPPPVKPRATNQLPNIFYTIHTGPNNAFTLKLSDKVRTSVVGFRDVKDAVFIGAMIESYFFQKKEWPDTTQVGKLTLSAGAVSDLVHVFVRQWEFETLKIECTRNILDFVSVDSVLKKKDTYSFSGSAFRFEAPLEFYQERFDELFRESTPGA